MIDIDFVLSQTDERPMYLQIMEQIKQRAAVGDWPPGAKLPSIRALAVSLSVSIITVKRAYLELERLGVIVTRQGQGSWISESLDASSLQMQELEGHLERVAELAKTMSLSEEDIVEVLRSLTEEQEPEAKETQNDQNGN